VSGSGGGATAVATATIVVGLNEFLVAVSPGSTSIYPTQTVSFTVSVGGVEGFSGSVTLSATGDLSP